MIKLMPVSRIRPEFTSTSGYHDKSHDYHKLKSDTNKSDLDFGKLLDKEINRKK